LSDSIVLLNPHAAGGKAAALAEPIRQWLAQHADQVRLEIPDTAEQSRHLIDALPHKSRVVVVGGDGTLNQLLPSLIVGEHTVALVPFGSGNDTARALGLLGMTWQQALQHALNGTVSRVDLGLAEFDFEDVGGRADDQKPRDTQIRRVPFISSFTSGFDSSVGLRAINGPAWLRGLPRYVLATVRELANLRTWHVQVVLDGVPVHSGEALFASTLNTASFGGGMPAVPYARMDDGKLDLLLAKQFNIFETILMLPRLLIGKHLSHNKVQTQPFLTLQIVAKTSIPLAADGEYLGVAKKIKVSVLPSRLAVVAATV
jgi:diacylglycerol kinase family enzyme